MVRITIPKALLWMVGGGKLCSAQTLTVAKLALNRAWVLFHCWSAPQSSRFAPIHPKSGTDCPNIVPITSSTFPKLVPMEKIVHTSLNGHLDILLPTNLITSTSTLEPTAARGSTWKYLFVVCGWESLITIVFIIVVTTILLMSKWLSG